MRVCIVGSWKEENVNSPGYASLRDRDLFQLAGASLGKALVDARACLIVGNEHPTSAEYHAVQGALAVALSPLEEYPCICLLRPKDYGSHYEEARRTYPDRFSALPSPDGSWNIANFFQVRESDATVVMGGNAGGYQAGLAAAVAGKRVIPIGAFGGAGQRLVDLFIEMRNYWEPGIPSREVLSRLSGPWNDRMLGRVVSLLGLSRKPTLMVVHGRTEDRVQLKNYLQNTLGLPEPLIMDEKAADGRTLPEKFEEIASGVDGAIALITPDDVGRLARTEKAASKLNARARQNVWLEVGWFWGRLGRDRFLLLRRDGVEIPSDLLGLEYVTYNQNPSETGDRLRTFVASLYPLRSLA